MISGCINAICMVGSFSETITHMTGTSTALGSNIARGDWTDVLYQSSKIASFILGSALSGSYLDTESFVGGRRYAHILLVISLLLFCAIGLEQNSSTDDHERLYVSGLLLIALASGMQNAMTTNYGSAVVRTTHVTGSLTDIGIGLGRLIWKRDFTEVWKLKLLTSFVLGYATGAGIGTVLFKAFKIYSLIFPASAVLLLAVTYRGYLQTTEGSTFEREILRRRDAPTPDDQQGPAKSSSNAVVEGDGIYSPLSVPLTADA